ncbi:hypothetical protein [Sphingosinicella xenopeptidilytica]|uniref:Tip attachment protein J domain-containing protein n=1 Tax=Sphingosinicella xenopeptidilytica TaxID=364098 RepID=A0ABW3C3W3_SPHXN
MAKAVRTIGTVVGVALVVVGVATANPALISAGMQTVSYSNLAASAIDMVAPQKPKFSDQGNPLRFQTNPQSGLPYAIGRTRMSGVRIYADTYDGFKRKGEHDVLSFGVLLSAGGTIDSIEKFTADGETITFNGTTGNGNGSWTDWMAQKVWLGGAQTSALALTFGGSGPPGWTSNHKLSGITHALWSLRYDNDGKKYAAGVPEPAWIGKWVKVYDPRLDSTYPGGSGSCRALNESTYVWSRNPALHALTWALGRWQDNKRTLGIGAPVTNIRVADFVEAANVADENAWGIGGVEWSTDSKWAILKRMLQAGGAVPTMTGAMIGCRVNTPRIAVATITSDDILDEMAITVTKPRRERFNTVIPRYRSESHEWEIISADPISVPDYVTEDGGIRQKEIDYPLVQAEVGQSGFDGDLQAGQLAAYDIVNSREGGPISWTTGPKFIGLKSGDCVTLDVPEQGLVDQDVLITGVERDPGTAKLRFTANTETSAKHAFALGETAVPPPPFTLTPPEIIPEQPDSDVWDAVPLATADGIPFIRVEGDTSDVGWEAVVIQYRADGGDWTVAGTFPITGDFFWYEIMSLDGETEYDIRLAYKSPWATGDWLEISAIETPEAGIEGPPGPPGADGDPGVDGTDGTDGADSSGLVINGNFETGDSRGWYSFAGTIVSSGAYSGTYAARVASASGGPNIISNRFAAQPGDLFRAACVVSRDETSLPDAACLLRCRAFDSSGSLISGTTLQSANISTAGWQPLSGEYTAPAGTVSVSVDVGEAAGTTGHWIVDAVSASAKGSPGVSGPPATSISVTRKAVNVWAYANGTVVSWADAVGLLKVYSGDTDVTASATLSATASSGVTGTINTATNTPVSGQPKGYYRVTAMTGDTGYLTLTAVYGGVTITEVFSVSKAKGGYEIVGSLPVSDLFEGRVVFLTTDDKLYRYTGSAWTKAVDGLDLVANSVTTNAINAGAVTAAKMAVTELSAITALIGLLRTATTGERLEIEDNVIRVYDASNNLRVLIGDLS